MLITAMRLGGLVVKTLVYQSMDPGSNPGVGKFFFFFFFFKKNAKISRRIYASLACKGIYIYIYIYVCMYVCIYIYIYVMA